MFHSMICDRPFDSSAIPCSPRFAGCGTYPVALGYNLAQSVAVVVLLGWAERVQEEGSG